VIGRLFAEVRSERHSKALRDGQMAAAHAAVDVARITRLSDNEQGVRLAIFCPELANPLWRVGSDDELVTRILKAWPALNEADCKRVLAHIDARVRLVIEAPSRDRHRMPDANRRSNWVNSWRFDSHDLRGN